MCIGGWVSNPTLINVKMGTSTCEVLLNVKEDQPNPGRRGDGREFRMKVAVCPAAFLIYQMLHIYCQLSKCMSLNPYSRTRCMSMPKYYYS